MIKKISVFLLTLSIILTLGTKTVFADDIPPGRECKLGVDVCSDGAKGSHDCMDPCAKQSDGSLMCTCQLSPVKGAFGKVKAPPPLAGFLQKDPTGAGAISQFLSNFVALLFSIAAIVLIFMILWGAFEWLTSGGDKEKLSSAQKRIINAFIGIILFAVAFAIIRVVGTFTGFTFFSGQNFTVMDRDSQGNIIKVRCNNGKFAFYSKNFSAECQKP